MRRCARPACGVLDGHGRSTLVLNLACSRASYYIYIMVHEPDQSMHGGGGGRGACMPQWRMIDEATKVQLYIYMRCIHSRWRGESRPKIRLEDVVDGQQVNSL